MGNMKPFVIAIAFALIAVVVVYVYIKQIESSSVQTEIPMARVVRATVTIPPRNTIREHMIEEIEMPENVVTFDNITSIDEILGMVSVTPIYENQLIMKQMFREETALEDLSRMLRDGERAVTIGVTEISGLGGNLKPGDNVDVLVTILSNDEVGVPSTFTVLRKVEVMAVGQDIGFNVEENISGGSVSKSVTVRVNPFQSEMLTLASEVGSLRLALRDPDDEYSPVTQGTALTEFVRYTPTRKDIMDFNERERQHELALAQATAAERQAYAAGAVQTRIPENNYYQDITPLTELGPPPFLVELILGGESHIIRIEQEN